MLTVRQTAPAEITADQARVANLLETGNVAAASAILGHPPTVRGVVVHGAARGRELGFPTANLSPDSVGLIPADGIYAGWLTVGTTLYPTAISIGSNPTFDGVPPRQIEAHVLDATIDLYDLEVEVAFVHRVRGQVKFTGIDALVAQISADVAEVRELLS